MAKVKPFDTSAFLDDEEVVAEYLTAALEDANPDVFLAAVGQVAKARGMSVVAENTGLGRESLYKALTPGAKPRYDTGPEGLAGSWCEAHGHSGLTLHAPDGARGLRAPLVMRCR